MRRFFKRQPVVLMALAVLALCETGCYSGPCGGLCARTGNAVRNVTAAVFRPFRGCRSGNCYSYGYPLGAEAPPLQYGTPAVVEPGTTVGPATTSPGATIVPGGSESSSVPSNSTESDASGLKPLPEETKSYREESKPFATPGPAPESSEVAPNQGAKANSGKTNYEAFRSRNREGQGRSGALARSLTGSPEPTSRSAKGSSASNAGARAADVNPLDNLPPLELPNDGAQSSAKPPRNSSAGETDLATDTIPAPPAESVAMTPTRLSPERAAAAAPPASSGLAARGIRRVVGVESKLAGGSLPTNEGLDWLVEKGYKTLLDLREENDVPSTFITEVNRRGLRYVSLPVSLTNLDAKLVSRFQFELSLADARPLYFCDTDGTRAGALWLIRRVQVDKVDPQVARRDAEELGLTDATFLKAAQDFLDQENAPKSAANPEVPAPAPLTPEPDNTPAPTPAPASPVDIPAIPDAAPTSSL